MFGAIGVEETSTTATTLTTPGSGFTALTGAGTASSTGVRILPEYAIVSATGPYTASGTLSQSRSNATAVVTYKVLGAASKLVMKTEPSSSVAAGGTFSTQPAVYVEDANGNVVVTDSSTVTATVGTGTGPLTGTTSATASSGVATFSGLAAPTLAQTGLELTFTDDSLASAVDTTSITVSPGTANKLVMKTEPSASVTAGGTFSTEPAIYIEDQYNNVLTGDNSSSVTVAVQAGHGTGPLTGTLTATASSGLATFSALAAPTLAQTGLELTFTDTGDSLSALNDTTSITVNAGAATQTRVETAADGSGSVVGAQNVTAGSSITVYAITRDAYGNFVANLSATWSLQNISGGVVSSDLTPTTGTSSTFTGHLVGSANIQVVAGGFTGQSGVQTVIAGSATQTRVETAANGSGSVVGAQNVTAGNSITVYAITRDTYGNFVANPSATWSLQGISGGVVSGDLVGGGASAVFTGHLVGSANIQAVASGFTGQSGVQTVIAGAATQTRVETAASGSGSVVGAQNVTAGNSITVYAITRDAQGNFVANPSAAWSLQNISGGVVSGDLTPTTGTSSTFSGSLGGQREHSGRGQRFHGPVWTTDGHCGGGEHNCIDLGQQPERGRGNGFG